MSTFLAGLIPVLLPILIGSLTMVGFEKLQYLSRRIAELGGIYKQLSVVLIAYVLTSAGAALGVQLPTELGQLAPTDISALLSAVLAFFFHGSMKMKQAGI